MTWAATFLVAWGGCVARNRASSKAFAPPFRPEKLESIRVAMSEDVAAGRLPGGVVRIERRGRVHQDAVGHRAQVPHPEAMTPDTVFDAASLTKVLATAPAILRLADQGKLDVEAPVERYLPGFGSNGKQAVTLRQLLTHVSGLRPGLGAGANWSGWSGAIASAMQEPLAQPPGAKFVYSDINFILLGEVVRRVSGMPLEEYVRREIHVPIGMRDTEFRPGGRGAIDVQRIAPTEQLTNGSVLRGVVHDPTARRMGGVAGHAGLFTTAADVGRFARMLLNGGELDGRRILQPETVARMTSAQSPPGLPARGLGWDIDSPYAGPRGSHFPVGSYGHTGWTGTSLWIDPGTATAVILMSNRNHPNEAGDVRSLRRRVGTLAAEALPDISWPPPGPALGATSSPDDEASEGHGAADRMASPGSDGVLNGVDVWARDGFKALKGKRVGLVTNHTGRDRQRRATIDLLHGAEGVSLRALFSPEHGIRGVLDEKVSDGRDEKTGLPVYSLYGDRRAPAPEQLAELDVLVFDIQDIGCRFYTYISTLGNCLEAVAKAGKEFVVLDRVNPVNGITVEGPVLTGPRSFVAWHEIPLRHGMTAGELARMFHDERRLDTRLTVVPCEGWRRSEWYDATGLPWVNPSPNMRSLTAATLYPGVGVMEFCALSVGRGTGTPFEILGAPYIDDRRLAAALNAAGLEGVRFLPARFTPAASVFQGKECGGVQVIVTDRERFRAANLALALACTLQRLHPAELKLDKAAGLLGDAATLDAIRSGKAWRDITATRDRALASFASRRARYLLYP